MQIDDVERRAEDPAEIARSADQEAIDVTGAGMETSGETEAEAGGSPAPASETDDGEDVEGKPDAELLAAAEAVLGLPPDRTRGHYVMDPAALRAEVGDRVDPSEDEPTSSEEAARIRRLRGLAADPDGLYRSHLVADEAMIARLAAVRARAPHAVDALDIVIGAARLSLRTRTPIEIPPIVLLGPPGCGKSWIVRELGKALGISTLSLLGTTMADAAPILGTAVGWKGAGPGRLAEALLKSQCSSLLVFIDEVEKMRIWDRPSHASDILLGLLDRDMAAEHEDRYYRSPMRADRLTWLFAANSIDELSDPFLDRCVVIAMRPPGSEERRAIVRRIHADVRTRLGLDPAISLDDRVLDRLDDVSLRRIAPVLHLAFGRAAEAGRDQLVPDDLAWACVLMGRGREPRRTIGFIQREG